MDNDRKLDVIFDWLVQDGKCDLVAVGLDDQDVYFIEVWTADHKAFELRFSREWMGRLSIEDLAKHIHSRYRRTRAFHVPDLAE